jgi:hypothetical protein
MQNAKVKRRFYYYNLVTRYLDATGTMRKHTDMKSELTKAFQHYMTLIYDDKSCDSHSIVYKTTDGDYVYILVDEINSDKIKFRLILSRDSLYPYLDKNGSLTSLYDILTDKTQKVAEVTHGVIFLNKGVLGLEYNSNGAKTGLLAQYIDNKSGNINLIEIDNMLNLNTLHKLRSDKELSLFRIKVKTNSEVISELIKNDDTFTALDCKEKNIQYAELVLSTRTSKKRHGFMFDFFNTDFVSKLFKHHKEDFEQLAVKYGYGCEEIDLLSDRFVLKQDFLPVSRSRNIKSDDAYNSIDGYYYANVERYA